MSRREATTAGPLVTNCTTARVHELVDEARDSGGLLQVLSRDPSFRLGVGEFELACHRVGSYASDDIWSCFPGNEGAACQMVEPLWFSGMEPRVDEARRAVIAHVGNPEDGFQGLYLCIPSRTHDQKIIEWGVAHPVWKHECAAAETEVYVDGSSAAPEKAPEETIGDPVVRRRERRDSEDSDEIGKG